MQYKDLKEMTIEDWDGKPFSAIVACDDEAELCDVAMRRLRGIDIKYNPLIVGYVDGVWVSEDKLEWKHVYPFEWNKKPKKRMTNRQLAMWLANGKGQMMYLSHTDLSIRSDANLTTNHMYDLCADNEECNDRIRVRNWGVEGWKEPTTDLLEDCK